MAWKQEPLLHREVPLHRRQLEWEWKLTDFDWLWCFHSHALGARMGSELLPLWDDVSEVFEKSGMNAAASDEHSSRGCPDRHPVLHVKAHYQSTIIPETRKEHSGDGSADRL